MQPPEGPAAETHQTPGEIAYTELVYQESGRLPGFIFFLVGDAAAAQQIALSAFRYVWDAFRRGDILGDAEDQLYRNATRAALQHIRKTSARGHLPPTTAPDREIIATGVVSGFEPQQRAAILLAAWAGVGYRRAGVATGVGEGRARDLTFAARQEYRAAQSPPVAATPACAEVEPLLSARLDEEPKAADVQRMEAHVPGCETCKETAALYEQFDETLRGLKIPQFEEAVREAALAIPTEKRRYRFGVLGRFGGLASGPAGIVLLLVVLVFFFHDCGNAPIRTGAGRTSDVLFMRAPGALVVMDTGSGREIGRVPAGAITADGEHVYSTRAGCKGDAGATTLLQSDVGTIKSTELGCLQGRVTAVAADDAAGTVYVSGQEGLELQSIDLRALQARGRVAANEARAFDPDRTAVSPDRSALFSLVADSGSARGAAVLHTDLRALTVDGRVRFPSDRLEHVHLAAVTDSRVLAYDAVGSRVRDLDARTGTLLSAMDVPSQPVPEGTDGTAHVLAISTDASLIYIARPTAGIVVMTMSTGNIVRQINPNQRYLAIAVSTDGAMVYAIESGGTFVVLDSATGSSLLRRDNAGLMDIVQVVRGQ